MATTQDKTLCDTRATELADELCETITGKGFREGDFFMTEADLAGRYHVSRTIAREAVSRLRGLGILQSRKGKGLLIARPNPVGLLSRSMPFIGQSELELSQLAQFRYTLEIGSVDLAVANATDAQVNELNEIVEQHRHVFEEAEPFFKHSELELKFHCLILKMTGNELISGMHQVLVEFFAKAPGEITGWMEIQPDTAWGHEAICEAIAQRDAETMRALLRKHLQSLLNLG